MKNKSEITEIESVVDMAEDPIETIEESTPAYVSQPEYYDGVVVDTKKLNVRTNPSIKSEVIGVLLEGTKVQWAPFDDEWCLVRYNREPKFDLLYCMKKYIQ